MSKKEDFQEIVTLINKRLEGFNFVLVTTNPLERRTYRYVSNLKREEGVKMLFESAVQFEVKENRKLAKIQVMKKLLH